MTTTPQRICDVLNPGWSLIYPGWRLVPDDYGEGIIATNGETQICFMRPREVRGYVLNPASIRLHRAPPGEPA